MARETVGSSSTGLDGPPSRTSHSASLHTRAQSMQSLDHYDLPPPPHPPQRVHAASAKDRLACLEIKSKISMPEEVYRPAPETQIESHPRCVESVIARPDSGLGKNDSIATKHCQGMYRATSAEQPPSVLYHQSSAEQNPSSEYRPTKPYMQNCGYQHCGSIDQQNVEFWPRGEQPGLYRTMSRATLIDQDSGSVYQLIENKRGKTCETFLLQQQPVHSPSTASRPFHGLPSLQSLQGQTSIDLGMLQQAKSNLHSVYQTPAEGKQIMSQNSCEWPPSMPRDSCDRTANCRTEDSDFHFDQELLLPDPDYRSGPQTNVERYIAVPISSTEQYLISSSGQTYLTEKLPSTSTPSSTEQNLCTSIVSASVHDFPVSERLPPIGANSRAASKMSLDILDEETQC